MDLRTQQDSHFCSSAKFINCVRPAQDLQRSFRKQVHIIIPDFLRNILQNILQTIQLGLLCFVTAGMQNYQSLCGNHTTMTWWLISNCWPKKPEFPLAAITFELCSSGLIIAFHLNVWHLFLANHLSDCYNRLCIGVESRSLSELWFVQLHVVTIQPMHHNVKQFVYFSESEQDQRTTCRRLFVTVAESSTWLTSHRHNVTADELLNNLLWLSDKSARPVLPRRHISRESDWTWLSSVICWESQAAVSKPSEPNPPEMTCAPIILGRVEVEGLAGSSLQNRFWWDGCLSSHNGQNVGVTSTSVGTLHHSNTRTESRSGGNTDEGLAYYI